MNQLITINTDKCNLSYSCIRVCPVKAIKVENNSSVVIPSRCIDCGHCVTVCIQNAVEYRHEKNKVKELLSSESKVSIICDPAIAAEFTDITDYRKFVAMLRKTGFDYVHEAAFGADIIAIKYKELYQNFKGKYYISTKCPAVVNFIEKYHPDSVENLAPFVPPYVAMAKVIKEKYGNDTSIVYLTSCIAAKDGFKTDNNDKNPIDAVITFGELRELFKENKISEHIVKYSDFDQPVGRKGGLFPISHGLLETVDINQSLLEADVLVTEGKTGLLKSVEEFEEGLLEQHIDAFYCHGCFMGPGMSKSGKKFSRRAEIIKYVKKRLKNIDLKEWKENIEKYKNLDYSRQFTPSDSRLPEPDEAEVNNVLKKMGKEKLTDQLGCAACGYPTCKDFAKAFVQGLTSLDMCYDYSTKNFQSYINKLNQTEEKLKQTQKQLKESEEKAVMESNIAKEASEITTAMLNKLRAGIVLVDENLKIIESNKKFIEIIGEDALLINEIVPGLKGADLKSVIPFYKVFENVLNSGKDIESRDIEFGNMLLNISVFTIRKNKVIVGIIRDLTEPDVKKEEIIQRAKDVIKENLKTVQQIAFLLGESAVKTEKTLNSIIETQKLRNKK